MKKLLALIALVFLSWPAFPLNKCKAPDGSIQYSDKACPDGSSNQAIDIPRPTTSRKPQEEKLLSSRSPDQGEINACLSSVKILGQWKDAESVRTEGTSVVGVYADRHEEMFLNVNAKNSYGAYVGTKTIACSRYPGVTEWRMKGY